MAVVADAVEVVVANAVADAVEVVVADVVADVVEVVVADVVAGAGRGESSGIMGSFDTNVGEFL
jgi:hypothetical protein